MGPPSAGTGIGVGCFASQLAGKGKDLGMLTPDTADWSLGMWNVTTLAGKEPELVWEVQRYLLDIVGSTLFIALEY